MKTGLGGVARHVVEQVRYIGADFLVGREETQIRVQARSVGL